MKQRYFLTRTQEMLIGVMMQSERVINGHEQVSKVPFQEQDFTFDDLKKIQLMQNKLYTNISLDEYFLVLCAAKSFRWLDTCARAGLLRKKDFKQLYRLEASVIEVRHIREHDENYATGGGRKRDRLFAGDENIMADATSTIVLDSGPLLGNRLNVIELKMAAESAYAILHDVQVQSDTKAMLRRRSERTQI